MPRALRPVSVAGIEFDALIEEQRQLDAQIPQYSTEDGFQFSDAIIVEAETLSMTLFVTDTPVTWRGRHPGRHADEVCSRLEALYFAKEPITVQTTDAVYTMMGIQSISFQKSFEVGYSREIPVTFRKVRITNTRVVASSIPTSYGSSGASGASAGSAKTNNGFGLFSGDSSTLAGWDDASGRKGSDGLGTVVGWINSAVDR